MTSHLKHSLFIATVVLFMTLIFLDQNGIGVALTHIQNSFQISNTLLQWVMNSMLIATAISVLIAGKLGDMFGARRIFLVGLFSFMVASILCGIAPTIEWMLAGRALQGLTASFMLTNYIVLIHHQYDKAEQPKVLGLCVSISAISGVAAPAIAGALTQWLSWRGFFLINVPICLLCIALCLVVVEKAEPKASRNHIDYIGMLIFIIAIAGLISAVTESSQFGWHNASIITTLVISLLCLVGFYFYERKQPNPLLHVELLKDSKILTANLIIFCLQVSLICTVYYAIWMQHILGFKPFETGLAYLPQTLPLIFMAALAGRWASKKGFRQPITLGISLGTLSIIALTFGFLQQSYLWIAPCMLLWSIGISCTYANTVAALMSYAAPEHKGMVSGVNQTFRSVAGALGLAAFGSILATLYGNQSFVNTTSSKLAYTHAFVHAMLLPTGLTVFAMILAWRYITKPRDADKA